MEQPPKGVLLMAYGSPNSIKEVEPYYTDIRRGRKPPPELLEELQGRYRAIGGKSPLLEVTQRQAQKLQQMLGQQFRVYLGMRHWNPWIHEAVEEMLHDGVQEAVGLVMAPHYSDMSIGRYIGKVEEALEGQEEPFSIRYIRSWHNHPLYLKALGQRIRNIKSRFSTAEQEELMVVFTAHSLPEKIVQEGDPYPEQLQETSQLLAQQNDLPEWRFAYQSAGRTEMKWLGPDLLEVLHKLHEEGRKAVLVCSIGFITDHLEVLYDIDIEAQQKAQELGMHLERTPSLNDDPILIDAFAEMVLNEFND